MKIINVLLIALLIALPATPAAALTKAQKRAVRIASHNHPALRKNNSLSWPPSTQFKHSKLHS